MEQHDRRFTEAATAIWLVAIQTTIFQTLLFACLLVLGVPAITWIRQRGPIRRVRGKSRAQAGETSMSARELRARQAATTAVIQALGVLQRPDPRLRAAGRPFHLPQEQSLAQAVLDRLLDAAERLRSTGSFSNGIGLAAPQLGIDRRAAVVVPGGTQPPLRLLNPTIVAASADTDVERYEGCLSFFDVSGRLARPRRLEIAYQSPDGTPATVVCRDSLARLVAHEIDHLDGRLYPDRMAPGRQIVPVEADPETRAPWRYPSD